MHKKKTVVVVGSGLAGLTVVNYLTRISKKREDYEVILLESHADFGISMNSQKIGDQVIDVPYRGVLPEYYPNSCMLIKKMGLETTSSDWSVSIFRRHNKSTKLIYDGKGLRFHPQVCTEWLTKKKSARPTSVLDFFVGIYIKIILLLTTLNYALATIRLQWTMEEDMKNIDSSVRFIDYLEPRLKFFRGYQNDMLIPFLAVLLSCSTETVQNYPADCILPFLIAGFGSRKSFRKNWMEISKVRTIQKVTGGTRNLAVRLTSDLKEENIRFSTRVKMIDSCDGKCYVTYVTDGVDTTLECDAVVSAVEIQTLEKIQPRVSGEAFLDLSGIKTENTRIIIHRDDSLLPQYGRSGLNIVVSEGRTEFTGWLNPWDLDFAKSLKEDIFQTWNPSDETVIDKKLIISDCSVGRPCFTTNSKTTIDKVQARQGFGNQYFCGSWSLHSMPLLENAVNSAYVACLALTKEDESPLRDYFGPEFCLPFVDKKS